MGAGDQGQRGLRRLTLHARGRARPGPTAHSPRTVSTATGAQGSYAWVDGEGRPNRGDAALRASASLNHSGVAAIFAGSKTTAAQVFEDARHPYTSALIAAIPVE